MPQVVWMFRLARFLFASALFIALVTPSGAGAQSDDPWTPPVNLSHSGVATNPAIVTDSEGVVHVVWQDDLANFVYTRFEGDHWSDPVTTTLNLMFNLSMEERPSSQTEPMIYTGPNPLFIPSMDGFIFAFWISPQGGLFSSKVENLDFGNLSSWDSARPITNDVASFAIAIDARGEMHLAYLRTITDPFNPANPPGIYYTRSKNGGANWGLPVLLYESSYFRSLEEGEANLSLATAGTEEAPRVYLVWDNRPRKQVLLAQSADGGVTWEQPMLIAGPAPESGVGGPFDIHINANRNTVVLVWQSGQLGGACNQLYQSSEDAGATWSDPQPVIEDLLGCAPSTGFLTGSASGSGGTFYFLTKTQGQAFLTAWNGRQWSRPQAESILSGFEEPEIYTQVVYGCQRASLSGERLYVVGCDEGGGGDIWVTSRDLGSNTSWFSSPVWSQPSPVTEDPLEIEAMELVATGDGFVHAVFSQSQDSVIYYTYWNGDSWSHIVPVMKLPDGEAGWPAIAAGPENELFLITPNSNGVLYLSRATSGDTASESRWSTPARPEIDHNGDTQIGSVDVASDGAGTLYVAYSVPVNEERGIYLVQSKDNGASWSEPLRVFDGATAGFDLVGAPSLLSSADGVLHVMWREQSVRGDGAPQPLSLYYTQSEDGGRTFSDAKLIVEEPVAWREMAADGEGNLHLFWQPQDTKTTVWDQISLDGGRSWELPQGLPSEGMIAAVAVDPAGRLHLVDAGPGSLGHWLWDNTRWQSEAPLEWSLGLPQDAAVELVAATVNNSGKMVVVLAATTGPDDLAERLLLYSTRTLELPEDQTPSEELPTQTPLPLPSSPATSTPESLLTPASTTDSEPANSQNQTDRIESNSRTSPFAIALVPVALLLFLVLGIVIRRITQAEDR